MIDHRGAGRGKGDTDGAANEGIERHEAGGGQKHSNHGRENDQGNHLGLGQLEIRLAPRGQVQGHSMCQFSHIECAKYG